MTWVIKHSRSNGIRCLRLFSNLLLSHIDNNCSLDSIEIGISSFILLKERYCLISDEMDSKNVSHFYDNWVIARDATVWF